MNCSAQTLFRATKVKLELVKDCSLSIPLPQSAWGPRLLQTTRLLSQ